MSINVISEYISFSQENIKLYAQKIMGKQFNEQIFNKLLSVYVALRYHNSSPEFPNQDVSDIDDCLRVTAKNIFDSTLLPKEEMTNNYIAFVYSSYLDMINQPNPGVYEQINQFRKEKLGYDSMSFIDDLAGAINKNISKRFKFFRAFDTINFEALTYITTYPYLYNTELIHHIKFPEIYSEIAIEKAYEKSEVREQKSFVLYSLLSLKVLKDILNKKYYENYLVDFEASVLSKKNKLKRLLNIIENDTMKDKMNLKITYGEYLKYKKDVLDLIKKGYHFAVILDDKYEHSDRNEIELKVFSFIIITEDKYFYKEFKKYENIVCDY